MDADVKFKWNKPINKIVEEVTGGEKTLLFMAATWNKLYDPFVPMDTGTLAHDAVNYRIEGGSGIIHHKAPYAKKIYNGTAMGFRKEKHPLATAKWDEAAKQAGKAKILAQDTEAFIKRGG